jgi:hypothetical protein
MYSLTWRFQHGSATIAVGFKNTSFGVLQPMNGVGPEWHGIKAIFVDFLRQKAG